MRALDPNANAKLDPLNKARINLDARPAEDALSIGRSVLPGVGAAELVAANMQRATTLFGACSGVLRACGERGANGTTSAFLDRAMQGFADTMHAAVVLLGQADVARSAGPTPEGAARAPLTPAAKKQLLAAERARAREAALAHAPVTRPEDLLTALRDASSPQHAAFGGLQRETRERLTHALKQTAHKPNPSANATLQEIAQALIDRAEAQRGGIVKSMQEPQPVRVSHPAADATEALAVDIATVRAVANAQLAKARAP